MSKIKLVDFDPGVPYETEFGTCELCMSTGIAQESRFKFEYEDGTKEWVDGSYWDYGYHFTVDIDNTASFAGWLFEQDFKPDFRIDDFWVLKEIVSDFTYTEEGAELPEGYYL